MNKKFLSFLFLGLFLLFFFNCGKKKNVKLAQTYYKLALLELNEKEQSARVCKQALGYINKAIEQENNPEYLAFKATLLFQIGQEKEGDLFFQKALQANPESRIRAEILNNKACLLAQIGIEADQQNKINQAMNTWDKLVENKNYLTPQVALVNQSNVYFKQKNYDQAKDKLLKAIKLDPSYLDAHYYLGVVAYELKDYQLSKNELKTVLFLEPDHYGAKQLSSILEK